MTEELSRLLDGELPPEEAAALRRRIAQEPALEAEWARLQWICRSLGALAVEPPPPGLDARVLGAAKREVGPEVPPPPPGRERWRRRVAGVGWALAAGLLVTLALPRGAPELTLLSGAELVDGELAVYAGDLRVDVDGRVRVEVEPAAGGALGTGPRVTLTVYEGRAVVRGSSPEPVEVTAGESRRFGEPPSATAAPRAAAPRHDAGEELRRRLAVLELENAVLRGQLQHREGSALPFPEALPAVYTTAGFPEATRRVVGGLPDTRLVESDCEEFPCVAIFRTGSGGDAWNAALQQVVAEVYGEDSAVFLAAMQDDRLGATWTAVAVTPTGDEGTRREVKTRFDARVEPKLDALHGEEAGATPGFVEPR